MERTGEKIAYVSKSAFDIVITFCPKMYFRKRYSQQYAAYLKSVIPVHTIGTSVFNGHGTNVEAELPYATVMLSQLDDISLALHQDRQKAIAEWQAAFPGLSDSGAREQSHLLGYK